MVQDALYRLDPRGGGLGMVFLAWIGFVGSWIVGIVGGVIIVSAFVGAVVSARRRTCWLTRSARCSTRP